MLPLDGVTILDLTRLLPGAAASQTLAAFGADVIKIEEPGVGDYARNSAKLGGVDMFAETNRNKKSVELNLKEPADKAAFLALAQAADVVLEGYRPGVMARLGLDFESLRASNPRLIYAAISGYGQTDGKALDAGHDINYMATAGVLDLIGARDGAPAIPGVQIADLAAGAMQAVTGILLALLAREKSGRGQFVDASMTDGLASLLTIPFASLKAGKLWRRGAETLCGKYPCYNVYETADARWVAVGALEPKFWAALCRALVRPDLVPLQYTDDGKAAAQVAAIFATRPLDGWADLFRDPEACVTPVLTLAEAIARKPLAIQPVLSETPGRLDQLAPALGADNHLRKP